MRRIGFPGRAVRAALEGSLFLAAGSIAGCDGGAQDCAVGGPVVECDECARLPEAPDPPESSPFVCTRRIAVDPAGVCPGFVDASGNAAWLGAPMFPGLAEGVLRAYCRYEWQSATLPPDSALLQLQSSEDCTFVAPQQADPIAEWAREGLLGSVTQTPSGPRPQAGPPKAKEGGNHVRVVVLDTAPDADPAVLIEQGQVSRHGDALAHLIRDVACADPTSCAVHVKTTLVMPEVLHQGVVTPSPGGGNVGRLGDVAQALWAEIAALRGELDDAAAALASSGDASLALALPIRLVHNESFGWSDDGSGDVCGGDPSSSTRVDVRALFDVFQAAACLGGVHVAAAGNHTGGAQPTEGLLCPARWHEAVTPSQTTCEALFGAADFEGMKATFEQVTKVKYGVTLELFAPSSDGLLSVGGVDHGGAPIVMTRPRACPEAVALGIGGVGWDTAAPSPSVPPILFGTSVSAAIASGRIAAEWAQASSPVGPHVTASEVVAKVLAGGSGVPSFVTGGACSHLAGPPCESAPVWIAPPPAGATADQNHALGALAADLAHRTPVTISTVEASGTLVCPASIPHCVRETPASYSGLVWGQPTDPVCLKCGLWVDPTGPSGRPAELWLEPSGQYTDSSGVAAAGVTRLTGAVLVIEGPTGAVIHTQDLDLRSVLTSSTVTLDVGGLSLAGARAWLSVYADSGDAISQQIFVND